MAPQPDVPKPDATTDIDDPSAAIETASAADDFATPTDFPASRDTLVPSGAKARVRANIAALELLDTLRAAQRPATLAEQKVLAAWSGWGAVPHVFDNRNTEFADDRATLTATLGRDQYRQAEASILNAHYTDPAIAAAVWGALGRAGFTGGRVLEPGCGSGTFISHAPQEAVMVGVEADATTAAIAALLYPSAQIRHEGFETTRVPENSFTAAIGNVPFGRYAVTDPAHNPARHSIHNHFIIKALALTAPGGYVTVLTSRYTMDSVKQSARRDIAATADLIGAIRLPSTAFARVAGTEVVTDLLVLRRRDPQTPAPTEPPHWITTEPIEVVDPHSGDAAAITINSYFAANPHNLLGAPQLGHGLHGSQQLLIAGANGPELATQITDRLAPMIDSAIQRGHGLTATSADLTDVSAALFDPGLITAADRGDDTPLYTLRYNPASRGIDYWAGHDWQTHKTPKTLLAETRELIGLRDVAESLVTSQRDARPSAERDQLRGHLNTLYDNYVRRYGPLNRFTWVYPNVAQERHDQRLAAAENAWRTSEGTPGRPYAGPVPDGLAAQWDTDAWEAPAPYKKRRHLDGGMRHDPGWGLVAALEIFDDDTGQARKAPIFSTDLLTARTDRRTADTPEEALAMCLDRAQRVDIDVIAALLEVSAADARDLIAGLVYPSLDDPEEFVPAVTALSGNVRTKLTRALEAAATNPIYSDYAHALQQVLPAQREAEDIKARPGAPWIPASVIAAFAETTFGTTGVTVEHIAGRWVVDIPNYKRHSRLMTDEWGIDRRGCDAVALLEAACNSKAVLVNDDDGNLNPQATFAAQAKMTKISEEFTRWLWTDDTRRDTLVAEYNRRFNSLRAPAYNGAHMRFPGMSDHFSPHFYQRNAVARIIAEPTVLLDHVVGAGKTGSLVAGAIELRGLGLVRQPWLVVPNSITEQVGREAKQWYPAAKVLLGSSATTTDGRRRFIAQTASSDWDLVVIPQSAFTAINVSTDIRVDYIEEQLDTLRQQLETAEADRSKKRIELAIKTAKARLEKLMAATTKDAGLRFEESGCDYLMIDEAHTYKNLGRTCNIEELSCPNAAQRAEDLALKLKVLRQRRRDEALAKGIPAQQVIERVATFATGTPIANSLGELWVMQTYLRPDLLEQAGVADLGDWGAAFTATTTTIEVNATGTKLRPVTRVGKFTNLPELLALSSIYTDVVTRDQVPVALPTLHTGQRQIISLQPDIEVVDFITDLGWRLDNLDARQPQRDNQLKISTDGRNVSLDPRLGHLAAPPRSRAAAVAEQIMRVDHQFADRSYLHPDTREPAGTGALQIVFCDRGTPSKNPGQFSIYQAVKDELTQRGMPETAIRFIHDAKNLRELKSLFAQCNRGDVSVLIGSTEKMGTGVNVQARAAALHHVDVPWRPCDLEQREGRILRQGNQNLDGIHIFNYVTEGSYDTVMWQKVQAKALFIEQMHRNEIVDTEIEDLSGGDIGAAAAETKAIATGDPRYLRQVELDDTVKRLSALDRAHTQSVRNRDWQVRVLERAIPNKQRDIDDLAPIAAIAATHAASDNPPRLTIGETTYTQRVPAAQALAQACRSAYAAGKNRGASQFEPIGATIHGVDIIAARDLTHDQLLLRLAVPSRTADIDGLELLSTGSGVGPDANGPKQLGLLRRVENLYNGLPEHHARLQREHDRDQAELDDFLANPPAPFEHADELAANEAEFKALTLELRMAAESPEAKAKAAQADQRLKARGRKPGWSLLLNPTPALLEELGYPTADALRKTVRARERLSLEQHQHGHDVDGPSHDL